MVDPRAKDRYRIAIEDAEGPQRWFRSVGVLVANIAGWFDGIGTGSIDGTGPVNPGGRTIRVIDNTSGHVVLEFVEEFGDDARRSLAMLESDIESQTVTEFESRWL